MITPTLGLWLAGISALIAMMSLLYTVHASSRRQHELQAAVNARVQADVTNVQRQVGALQDEHSTFKEEVSRALDRVYDKIDSVHDLVVQIALGNKGKDT